MTDPAEKLACHCLCGGALTGVASPPLALSLVAAFDQVHQGEGCGPATREQAAAARRREERQLARSRKDW